MRLASLAPAKSGTLTRRLTQLGHEVYVANSRGPASLTALAKETGAKAVEVRDAAHAGEVVVVTIPEGKIAGLAKDLFADAPKDVVIIDTGNYYPRQRDGRIADIEAGMTESRWVANHLGRPVIKTFNNIYAQHLLELGTARRKPWPACVAGRGRRRAGQGNRDGSCGRVGFDPVDAGGLDESWRQQPGTPVYAADFDAAGVRRALAEASKERGPQFRATEKSPGTFAQSA